MSAINSAAIKQAANSFDYFERKMSVGSCRFTVCYLGGTVDKKQIDDSVIRPLFEHDARAGIQDDRQLFDFLLSGANNTAAKVVGSIEQALDALLSGYALFVLDELEKAVCFDVRFVMQRSVSEPTDENVLKGAKDCFVESAVLNMATIRTKLRTNDLRFKNVTIGRRTRTVVAIAYISGITNEGLLDEIQERLSRIDEDGVLSPAVIEEALTVRKFSFFPLCEYTERPDKLCANLLEGRVGIIVDGLPTVYILPAVFNSFMQAPEDYSFNYLFASGIRLIRFLCLIMAIFLPAFYIAITTFHPEMIPVQLAYAIIRAKENVPFPSAAEVFFMLFAFELLQEAGLRLPKTIGQAVSIVGGLIIGEAAVSAKLLSPAVIVVVALSGISGFTVPKQDFTQSVRICRVMLALSAAMAGFVGMSIVTIALLIYLCSLESFNVPYLAPFVSMDTQEILKDTFIRPPLYLLKKRPRLWGASNRTRKGEAD